MQRLPAFAVALALALTGCVLRDPIMVTPPGLLGRADVLPVSGKSGGLLWNPPVVFGGFHTTEVRRGWREDSSWNWWGIDVDERWDAQRATSFILEGPGRQRWEARCLARAHWHHVDKPVGFHFGTDGIGLDRRTVESASYAMYECAFQSADRGRWELLVSDADPSGFGGVVLDEQRTVRARVGAVHAQTGRPYTYTVSQPVGFLVETGGETLLAVERAFQGKVILSRATPAQLATLFAAVATALLLWEPMTG